MDRATDQTTSLNARTPRLPVWLRVLFPSLRGVEKNPLYIRLSGQGYCRRSRWFRRFAPMELSGRRDSIFRRIGQRPGDVRAMTWPQYDGDTITLRQEKTGKLVEVPCMEVLRRALDQAMLERIGTVIVAGPNGQSLTATTWRRTFSAIRRKAGLDHLQARDLRRTFVVNAARAGATVPEIAASTGHSIDHTQEIFEHYLPRDVHMARAGIIKLERRK